MCFYPHTLINTLYSFIHRLYNYEGNYSEYPEGKFYPQGVLFLHSMHFLYIVPALYMHYPYI